MRALYLCREAYGRFWPGMAAAGSEVLTERHP